jgi:hypothetical protein
MTFRSAEPCVRRGRLPRRRPGGRVGAGQPQRPAPAHQQPRGVAVDNAGCPVASPGWRSCLGHCWTTTCPAVTTPGQRVNRRRKRALRPCPAPRSWRTIRRARRLTIDIIRGGRGPMVCAGNGRPKPPPPRATDPPQRALRGLVVGLILRSVPPGAGGGAVVVARQDRPIQPACRRLGTAIVRRWTVCSDRCR